MDEQAVFWLANLARAEEQLDRSREQERQAGARLRLLDGLLREMRDEAAAARVARDAVAKEVRALEARLAGLEAELQKLRDQRRLVQTPREQEALERQGAAKGAETGRLEAEALRRIEALDAQQREIARLEDDARRQQARNEEEGVRLAAAARRAADSVAEATAEVERCQAQLPSGLAAAVGRLRGRPGAPVVRLADGACGGCGAQLPLQEAIAVERGRTAVRCQTCGRFVVAPA